MRRPALQVTAQVREYPHWSARAGFLCPNPRLAGRVIWVEGRENLLFTAYFEHSVGFRSDINANLMQDVCFLTREGKLPFISGADFNFPPSLWQDLSIHGGSLWLQKLGASVVIPRVNHTHVPCGQRSEARHHRLFLGVNAHQTSDTEMRDCEVSSLGSALWCQADAQHQLRIGGVQTADWEVQEAEIGTTRTYSKDRTRNTLKVPTQQSGTKQDAIVSSKARSFAARMVRKTRKLHAPNMITRVVSWKRQMSWATLWRPGAMPQINIG